MKAAKLPFIVFTVLLSAQALAAPKPCPVGQVRVELMRKVAEPGSTRVVRALDFDEVVEPGEDSKIYPGMKNLRLKKHADKEVQVFTGRVSGIVDTSYYAMVVQPKSCEILELAKIETRSN